MTKWDQIMVIVMSLIVEMKLMNMEIQFQGEVIQFYTLQTREISKIVCEHAVSGQENVVWSYSKIWSETLYEDQGGTQWQEKVKVNMCFRGLFQQR